MTIKVRITNDKAITRYKSEEDRLFFKSVMTRARDSITDPPHPKIILRDETEKA